MLVNRANKFRIYPNKKQTELINKTIGCSRFVFNFFLGKQKDKDDYWHTAEEMKQNGQLQTNDWKGGEYLNKYETVKAVPSGASNFYIVQILLLFKKIPVKVLYGNKLRFRLCVQINLKIGD